MDWLWFHLVCAIAALSYAVFWDMRPLVGRQFVFGAEIHLVVVGLSWLARKVTDDISPVTLYSLIDMAAVSFFALIMFRKKAIWAALCVIIHSVMLALHMAFFIAGEISQAAYLWTLGVLTFLVCIIIGTGTAASRHEFGRRWDDFLAPRLRGWSWSATFAPRLSDYRKRVG